MSMKNVVKGFLSLIVVAIVTSCANSSKSYDSKEEDSLSVNGEVVNDSLLADMDSVADSMGLNGIRFAHFTDEDWLDNEYIRCLRTYLDDYLRGKTQNEELDPYKDKMQGGFIITGADRLFSHAQ